MKTKVIQKHHISYDPEVTVHVYKGEHWILTQLQRRRYVSKGFIRALKFIILILEDRAIKLEGK